jgi:hypothetical protein
MVKKNTESGQSLVIVAVGFVAIIAFIGFAIDTGILFLNRVWLGQAVDAATLSAGYELPNIRGACARAVEYLEANDYIAGSKFSFEIIFPSVPDTPGGDPGEFVISSDLDGIQSPTDCVTLPVPSEHEKVHYDVQVVGKQLVPVAFMGVLGFGDIEAGLDGLAERTHTFDIALVLDNSKSMDSDTCGYFRDVSDDPDGYTTYAANNVYPVCSPIVGDDFEAYGNTDELMVEWYKTGLTSLHASNGHDGGHWVEVSEGELANTFDVSGNQDVTVYFWMKNVSMDQDDEYIDIQWRIWDGVSSPAPAWVPLSTFQGNAISSEWKEYGIVLPNGASDTEFLSIRFKTREDWNDYNDESFGIDDVSFKSCPPVREQLKPTLRYVSGGTNGCNTISGGPMNAHIYAPWTLNPRVPVDVNAEPETEFVMQPLYDVLRSTETFVDLIDSRRFDTNPPLEREDQFSLTTFSDTGHLLYDLTLDYEDLKNTLFTGIESDMYTNIGDGMRIGIDTLTEGRSNTIHFMVLLSDGWPNKYGPSGNKCGGADSMPCQQTFTWIDQQIEYAVRENVTIFTIGLGNAMTEVTFDAYGDPNYNGQKLLEHISEETGGEAYFAPTTEELEQIFEWIAEAIFVRLKG